MDYQTEIEQMLEQMNDYQIQLVSAYVAGITAGVNR